MSAPPLPGTPAASPPANHSRQALWLEILTVGAFCAFLFFYGLGNFGLVGPDEPRYAQIAREMLERGDWITPRLYGQIWLEKPALYYWSAMLSYRVFGISDWAARLPSALLAAIMIAAVYFFARRFRVGAQLDAALMTAASAAVIGFARAAATDMELAAPFVVAMLAWWGWYETRRARWLIGFYLFVALSTLARGPVAALLAALIVIVFAMARRQAAAAVKTLWPPGVAVFLAVALPWYILAQVRNPQFFYEFLWRHNVERFATKIFHHVYPFWYYLPVLLLALAPWTVLTIAAIVAAARQRVWQARDEFPFFLLIWAAVVVIFFSISLSKLPGYVLPAVPALTILTADWIRRRSSSAGRSSTLIMAGHAAFLAVVVAAAVLAPYFIARPKPASIPPAARVIAAGVAALVFLGVFATLRLQGGRLLRFVTLVPVILILALLLNTDAPLMNDAWSERPVAGQIAEMAEGSSNHVVGGGSARVAIFELTAPREYGLAFYLDRPLPRYELGQIPAFDHLVIAPQGSAGEIQRRVPGRRLARVGGFPPQRLEYFWVFAPETQRQH